MRSSLQKIRISNMPTQHMKVWRIKNGIMLLDANFSFINTHASHAVDTGFTVADFMQLDISFYLLDTEGATKAINQEGVIVCGFPSISEAMGHSILAVSKKESAIQLLDNCHRVIKSDHFQLFDECHVRKDGISQEFLSIKLPWYDFDQQIIGVCGFSIVLGRHAIAAHLALLGRLKITSDLLIPEVQPIAMQDSLKQLALPKREQECLEYTIKGYTAKMIAKELGLSYRTIESYLDNLKTRLGANTRRELIQMAYQSPQ